ncbi:TIGR03564 family F420-dependent LLM class oxidoreductase [Streptomyces sp. SID13031]|uniref:TIGR03564 family F420-dependent LLM class oxidoreductase n=1 Tax=Streptomyces sp. SID13031 TaxID=2706046 RepID=UPI0013C8E2CB|nr:TIGR03564 family F420-dependent LLM class oxidoreductase [Streptomyces sp. SID13031]NEA34877.1 TIGR03564 family F420-dependent LLM class oxidoreductase [Streptomyces sp. SID13031]
MRIGLWIEDAARRLDEIAADARAAQDHGISRIWFSQRDGWDSLSLITALAPLVPRIRFGVGVVPIYPRHPLALAAQALSVQAATGNRLTLGIGSSHPVIVEGQYGLSMDQPAKYLRSYVEILAPLLAGEPVDVEGAKLTAKGRVAIDGALAPELLVAALGPRMLQIAGELTAGTITSWAGPEVIADYIRPTLDKAAPGKEIIACVCVAVTSEPAAAHQWIRDHYGMAGSLPAYRAILDRGSAAGPEDTAVLGDEAEVLRQLQRFADAGATEFMIAPVGTAEDQARTIAFAHSLTATFTS